MGHGNGVNDVYAVLFSLL